MHEPLVSIVVITYNSSRFVLETLESCKAQTYENIELIISDDASTDNTVEVCKKWLNENEDRFVRSKIIESDKNSGIAPNLNRGIRNVRGEWVKLLAGDDYLSPGLIEKYIQYISENKEISVLHSNAIIIDENRRKIRKDCSDLYFNDPNCTSEDQFKILLSSGPVIASSAMIRSDLYTKIGLYDENAPFWEDTPFWIRVTKAGLKLTYLDYDGTYYRRESNSIQISDKNVLYNKFQISKITYRYKYLISLYPLNDRFKIGVQYWTLVILINMFNNKKNIITVATRRCVNKLFQIR